MMEDQIKHIISRLNALERHIINLIIPIQNISDVLRSHDSIAHLKQLVNQLRMPIEINDKKLQEKFDKFNEMISGFTKEFDNVNKDNRFAEIKYIGKRLLKIEQIVDQMKEKGIKQELKLNFTCDGYDLVPRTQSYDENEEPVNLEKQKLDIALRGLSVTEKDIVLSKLGLGGKEAMTFKALSEIYNVSPPTASHIFKKAIRFLRKNKGKDIKGMRIPGLSDLM